MKIILTNLSLVNFKGLRNFSANFHPEFTRVQGDNATGKSTIADAISWLLFGKDMLDRKDFEVKTLDNKGQVIPRIDHEVTGVFFIDGVQVTLKRILKEKWVKKQGTSETVFTGNETLYFVNDVPKSQKDYQDYINQIIPEQTFKLLTNPAYFNSIKWQDRRAMLTAIANIPDDDTIAGEDFADILSVMRGERETLENLKKGYAAKKSKLKAAIEQIPARLDELSRNTPEPQDWDTITKAIIDTKAALSAIDAEIADASKVTEAKATERSKAIKAKSDLEKRKSDIELNMLKLFSEKAGEKDRAIAEIKRLIETKQQRVKELTTDINFQVERVNSIDAQIASLRKRWESKNSEALSLESLTDTCPTCRQRLPETDLAQQRNSLAENFSKAKNEALEAINKEGMSLVEQKKTAEAFITEKKSLIAHLDAEIISLKTKLTETEGKPTEGLKPVATMLAESAEYQDILKAISEIVIPEIEACSTIDRSSEKSELQSKLEGFQKQYALRGQITAAALRREELLSEESILAAQMAELEGFEYKLSDFQSRKMQAVEDSVNSLFKGVKFRMFETQINGGISDTCQTLINGVPYSDANRAAQINAGLEIIETFGKVHDMSAPICIDNAEAVNNLCMVDNAQMIGLYVTEGKLVVIAEDVNKVA